MTMPLRTGDLTRLGEYELVGRLGAGGMGTVYLGRARDGRPVAIKVIRADLAWDDELRGRFRSEVNRVRQVPAFSTAAVLDADPDHDPPYLVVEYVDGPSLAEVLRKDGPLSQDATQSMAIGITAALIAIHGAGVIHRDLKPGNVLFAMGGVKVIDFGIARPLEVTSQHTRTDQMVGTVAYMAPERFDSDNGRAVGTASDIFAWGVVVAFAATGRTPFSGESAPATAMRILTQEPDLTGLREPLRGLVAWSLSKRPEDRPTARELLDALLGSTPTPSPPSHAPLPGAQSLGAPPASPAAATDSWPQHRPLNTPPPHPTYPNYAAYPAPHQRTGHQLPPPQPASRPAPQQGLPQQGGRPAPHNAAPQQGVPQQRGWPGPQALATPPHGQPRPSGYPAPPARPQRHRSRAFVALMVATGLLGTALTAIVLDEVDSQVNDVDFSAGEDSATDSYYDEYGGTTSAAPAAAKLKTTTPAAMFELVSRLLPDREMTHLRTDGSKGRMFVQFYLDGGDGPGMMSLSIAAKDAGTKPVRDGRPTVTVERLKGNCVQDMLVGAAWADDTLVQVGNATCLASGEKAPAPLTLAEAKSLAADPRWGARMDADLVDAGAENYPSFTQ
ncbi:serine/threonine protein kinase [Winogradskya humida]|uniref:Protein kinase domain-containing protein n=1 Tax=Winogradskya humida TaxID=113566 RepID=A0ABQ3ZK20_9ACTN|nr:serine/threonine-protein kinase [Actinoplanes humidus]GIE18902.1 hypothetical protein Ahu01nite_020040 [Actinoplanes humidus]